MTSPMQGMKVKSDEETASSGQNYFLHKIISPDSTDKQLISK